MKIKTSELIGAQLDWAVAKAVGIEFVICSGHPSFVYDFDPEIHCNEYSLKEYKCWVYYQPSTDWSQGGPLIEKFGVMLIDPGGTKDGEWEASTSGDTGFCSGVTPLIAICRAIVSIKLGEEIEVPEELV